MPSGSSPRVRGTPISRSDLHGSSPRVRGTRRTANMRSAVHPRVCGERKGRLLARVPANARTPVHPRVCGERELNRCRRRDCLAIGSSPRVRGTLSMPSWSSTFSAMTTVHPRVCGERWIAAHMDLVGSPARFIPACAGNADGDYGDECRGSSSGSSPRVRGTRTLPCGASRVRRFIPACAGNAPS